MKLTQDQIDGVNEMLKDYFSMNASNDVIEYIANDKEIYQEILDESYRDTFARDLIIDAIVKRIGLVRWPVYGDSQQYKDLFDKSLNDMLDKEIYIKRAF